MSEILELPTQKRKAKVENPSFMILYGKPKNGKSTILSHLDDCLIIDFEKGTKYLDAMSIECNSFEELKKIKGMLAKKKDELGKVPYKYLALDTATAMEDMIMPYAISLYKDTSMGKNYKGNDLRTLPNGSGYLYIREAFKKVVNGFKPLAECLILVGHCSDKLINKDGKDLTEMDFDLTGKLKRIISAQADAIGYVYRKKNQTIVTFKGGDDFIVEARPLHLRGKEFVVAESNEDNNITVDWSKIFI